MTLIEISVNAKVSWLPVAMSLIVSYQVVNNLLHAAFLHSFNSDS